MSNAFALLGADSDADSDSDEEAVFVGGQHQRALSTTRHPARGATELTDSHHPCSAPCPPPCQPP